jgi:hypothetical protein
MQANPVLLGAAQGWSFRFLAPRQDACVADFEEGFFLEQHTHIKA